MLIFCYIVPYYTYSTNNYFVLTLKAIKVSYYYAHEICSFSHPSSHILGRTRYFCCVVFKVFGRFKKSDFKRLCFIFSKFNHFYCIFCLGLLLSIELLRKSLYTVLRFSVMFWRSHRKHEFVIVTNKTAVKWKYLEAS